MFSSRELRFIETNHKHEEHITEHEAYDLKKQIAEAVTRIHSLK